MKTLNDLYEEYSKRYNGNPKYNFSYFITVLGMIEHHKTYIRPMIKWWNTVS